MAPVPAPRFLVAARSSLGMKAHSRARPTREPRAVPYIGTGMSPAWRNGQGAANFSAARPLSSNATAHPGLIVFPFKRRHATSARRRVPAAVGLRRGVRQ